MSSSSRNDRVQHLKQALDDFRKALEVVESAMLHLEEELAGEASVLRPESRKGMCSYEGGA